VLDFAGHRGCLTQRLLEYFGEGCGVAVGEKSDEASDAEPSEPPAVTCGCCTSCDDGDADAAGTDAALREIPSSTVPAITPEQMARVRSLIGEGRASLGTPRQLARFLCGLTSPATTRERLGRHVGFGLLARVPFAEVLALAGTLLG